MKKFPNGVEVVCGLIIKKNDKYLLIKSHKFSNKWGLAGGHIEPGETIAEAAIREGKEETGLQLTNPRIVDYGEIIDMPEFNRPVHLIYFTVELEASGVVKLQNSELNDYEWLTLDDILQQDLTQVHKKTLLNYQHQLIGKQS